MPNLIGGIVLGYIWQILINCVLSIVGKPLLALNTSAGYWGLIILMCWQQIGSTDRWSYLVEDPLEGKASYGNAVYHHLCISDIDQLLQAL